MTHFRSIFPDLQQVVISFANHRISIFLKVLKAKISEPEIQLSHITQVMNQTMYFGMSLGRVGLDFRSRCVEIFQDQTLSTIIKSLELAFEEYMQDPGLLPGPSQSLADCPQLALLFNRYMNMLNQLRICAPLEIAESLKRVFEDQLDQITPLPEFHQPINDALVSIYPFLNPGAISA